MASLLRLCISASSRLCLHLLTIYSVIHTILIIIKVPAPTGYIIYLLLNTWLLNTWLLLFPKYFLISFMSEFNLVNSLGSLINCLRVCFGKSILTSFSELYVKLGRYALIYRSFWDDCKVKSDVDSLQSLFNSTRFLNFYFAFRIITNDWNFSLVKYNHIWASVSVIHRMKGY